jgi:hypothetical protein
MVGIKQFPKASCIISYVIYVARETAEAKITVERNREDYGMYMLER